LHGANDFTNKKYKSRKNNRSWIMIWDTMWIVLTGVFYLIPQMALLLFIIVSSSFWRAAMAKFKSDLPKWLLVLFQFYMVL
jgi:hypothetical protein